MTSGEPSGPSAAKLGGYTLIGVGALAAVVGVTTAFTGGAQNSADAPAGSQPPSAAPSPEQPQPQAPQPPQVPQQPSPQQPSPQQPGQHGQAPSTGSPTRNPMPGGQQPRDSGQAPPVLVPAPGMSDGSDQATPKVTVRVYNNSTIKGLAHHAADDFRAAGYEVPEVGNYASGRIATTTVYFRPGTEEEQQAKQVADRFGARAEPRFEGLQSASPGVIAIITNDYRGPQ